MADQVAKRKIQQLVYLHGVHVKTITGLEIDQTKEQKRLYAEYQAGLISIDEIQSDINEYLKMRTVT